MLIFLRSLIIDSSTRKISFSFEFLVIFVGYKHLMSGSTSLELKFLRDSRSIPIIFNNSDVRAFVTWCFLFQRFFLLHSVKDMFSRLTQQLLEFIPISVHGLPLLKVRIEESNLLSTQICREDTSLTLIGKLSLLGTLSSFW